MSILCDNDEEKFAELICLEIKRAQKDQGSSAGSAAEKIKGKKPTFKGPSIERVLGHLDLFRMHGPHADTFFNKDSIQQALREAKKSCPDSLKQEFGDFFAMMEALSSTKSTARTSRRTRKAAASPSPKKHSSQLETSDSSDNESAKKGSQRKRRKANNESDSD